MSDILMIFTDFTLRNVALGAALLGISSGILGCYALLRQQSLLGDALSHAALPGVCLGFLVAGSREFLPILLGALITGSVAAFIIQYLTRRSRLKTDAAIGSTLSVFFALGIVLLTYIGNQNNAGQAGLESFLFGQAASIVPSDVMVMLVVTLLSIAFIAALWKELKVTTFDPEFAGSLGYPILTLELLMTSMIALAIVIGLQMVGVVLMAAMVIAPAAAARQWVLKLEGMVVLAAVFGALSGVVGAVLSSSYRGLATGPMIVICASVIVILSLLFAPNRGLLWAWVEQRKNHRLLQGQQVLVDLYKLSVRHDDPAYPSELGMMNLYYGLNAKRTLTRLEQQGFVEPVSHMREEGQHWRLTDTGLNEAQAVLSSLGNHNE